MTAAREIRLPAPHPDFRPRREGSGRTVTHPGTAVRIGDDLFEVRSARPSGSEWIYGLEPWDPGQVSRVYVDWGPGAEKDFESWLRKERNQARKNALAVGGQIFLGFLPANRQERLAQTLDFSPFKATLLSSILEIAIAAIPSVLFGIQFAGGGGQLAPIMPAWLGFLAWAVLAEGVIRLIINISSGDPVGTLFLAPINFRAKREPRPIEVMSDDYALCGDSLEVRAPSPKRWWVRAGGITYLGDSFSLMKTATEGNYHLYKFRKGGAGFPVADPARERELNIASDRAYALAPLWGFLSSEHQAFLEVYGRYRPRPTVLVSIGFNFLLSASIVVSGLIRFSAGVFGWWNAVPFVFAVILLGESVSRLLRYVQQGEATGSFMGALVKPVFYLLFQAALSGSGKPVLPSKGTGSSGR